MLTFSQISASPLIVSPKINKRTLNFTVARVLHSLLPVSTPYYKWIERVKQRFDLQEDVSICTIDTEELDPEEFSLPSSVCKRYPGRMQHLLSMRVALAIATEEKEHTLALFIEENYTYKTFRGPIYFGSDATHAYNLRLAREELAVIEDKNKRRKHPEDVSVRLAIIEHLKQQVEEALHLQNIDKEARFAEIRCTLNAFFATSNDILRNTTTVEKHLFPDLYK